MRKKRALCDVRGVSPKETAIAISITKFSHYLYLYINMVHLINYEIFFKIYTPRFAIDSEYCATEITSRRSLAGKHTLYIAAVKFSKRSFPRVYISELERPVRPN